MQYCGLGMSYSFLSSVIFPVSLSTQTTPSCLPSSVAVVIQIWLAQITGDDQALPCTATSHLILLGVLPSPNSTGRPAASLVPCPEGPRNCGQFSSAETA